MPEITDVFHADKGQHCLKNEAIAGVVLHGQFKYNFQINIFHLIENNTSV